MKVHEVPCKRPKVPWRVGYKSNVGKVRETNEDSLSLHEDKGLFIVADGMGGCQGGEIASQMAVEIISEFLKDKISVDTIKEKENVFKLIMQALFQANDRIRVRAAEDPLLRGMGTTIVLALCQGNDLYISHVGDSRAYLIRGVNIQQLTEDHSVVAQMVRAGNITKEEARSHKLKHMISQALGASTYLAPDLNRFSWEKGDYILLCTDGLTDMLDDQELLSTVLESKGEPEKGCEMLVELANKKGGRDNVTVILLYRNV